MIRITLLSVSIILLLAGLPNPSVERVQSEFPDNAVFAAPETKIELTASPDKSQSKEKELSLAKKIKTNHYKCDLDTQHIRKDNARCIDKPRASEPVKVAEPAQKPTGNSGNREVWLRAVGIPQSEWAAVDFVINGEAGWDGVTRWNTAGSGAYGICQSLPATKMASAGSDYMTNGLTQLKWCNDYALNRYGSWSYAAQWKQCVGYCVNSYNSGYSTYKDHTWW